MLPFQPWSPNKEPRTRSIRSRVERMCFSFIIIICSYTQSTERYRTLKVYYDDSIPFMVRTLSLRSRRQLDCVSVFGKENSFGKIDRYGKCMRDTLQKAIHWQSKGEREEKKNTWMSGLTSSSSSSHIDGVAHVVGRARFCGCILLYVCTCITIITLLLLLLFYQPHGRHSMVLQNHKQDKTPTKHTVAESAMPVSCKNILKIHEKLKASKWKYMRCFRSLHSHYAHTFYGRFWLSWKHAASKNAKQSYKKSYVA